MPEKITVEEPPAAERSDPQKKGRTLYAVELIGFSGYDECTRLHEKLVIDGYSTTLHRFSGKGDRAEYYRVLIGHFPTESKAGAFVSRLLINEGLEGKVVIRP